MVGRIGETSNLMNMISLSYQQTGASSQQASGAGAPPPPPPPADSSSSFQDPLGVFSSVDTDSDNTISESEYNILTEGILEVTGTELSSSFLDFDADGDGKLNGSELKSVLDEAGFTPPPPPPQQVAAAYEAQREQNTSDLTQDETLLAQLLEYLENRSGDLDINV